MEASLPVFKDEIEGANVITRKEKQDALLTSLAEDNKATKKGACTALNIRYGDFRKWLIEDSEFRNTFIEVLKQRRDNLADKAEVKLEECVEDKNIKAIEMVLTNLAPETYKPASLLSVNFNKLDIHFADIERDYADMDATELLAEEARIIEKIGGKDDVSEDEPERIS